MWILKAGNDKLISDNTELKESLLCTEYVAKKKNLILNEIKDHPKNGGKMEKIVKDLFQSMYIEDSCFDNSIGEVQIDMVTQLGKYTGERNRPILVTFDMP